MKKCTKSDLTHIISVIFKMKKYLVEECNVITIRDFRKELKHPAILKDSSLITKLEIEFKATRTHLITNEATEIDQKVYFRRTRSNFNGHRVWFSCPSCNQNAYKLYLPLFENKFKCRKCWDLDYELHLKGKTKKYPFIKYNKAKMKFANSKRVRAERRQKLLMDLLFWEEIVCDELRRKIS